jgi:hypothetical protein
VPNFDSHRTFRTGVRSAMPLAEVCQPDVCGQKVVGTWTIPFRTIAQQFGIGFGSC